MSGFLLFPPPTSLLHTPQGEGRPILTTSCLLDPARGLAQGGCSWKYGRKLAAFSVALQTQLHAEDAPDERKEPKVKADLRGFCSPPEEAGRKHSRWSMEGICLFLICANVSERDTLF